MCFLCPQRDGVQREGTGPVQSNSVKAVFDCANTAAAEEELHLSVGPIGCLSGEASRL